jgi:hypothetical protein
VADQQKFAIDQYNLICDYLAVGRKSTDWGETPFEAVVRLKQGYDSMVNTIANSNKKVDEINKSLSDIVKQLRK